MFQSLSAALLVLPCLHQFTQATPLVEQRQTTFIDANYNFLGCYHSSISLGPLIGLEPTSNDGKMNYEKCAVACFRYDYFGISNGNGCLCGDYINGGVQDPPETCSSQCSGLGADTVPGTCGGPKSGRIYIVSIFKKKVDGATIDLPGDIQQSYSVGCFSTGAIQTQYFLVRDVSVDRCQVLCRGYRLFGIYKNGGSCYCYDQLASQRTTDQTLCNSFCPGGTQSCGGSNYQSVYSTASTCSDLDQQLPLKNSGFEAGTAYWPITALNPPNQISWAVRTDATAFQGSRYARIDSKAAGAYMALAQNIGNFCPGIEYEVSWTGKEGPNSACTTWIAYTRSDRLGPQTDGLNWATHSRRFFAPSVVVELSFIMQCDGQGSGSFRKLYLDDVKLRRYVLQSQ